MPAFRMSDRGNEDVYFRVSGGGVPADPYWYNYGPGTPLYKVQNLGTASGTVVAGSANYRIVIDYHTEQNLGTATGTMTLGDGSTVFQQHDLPSTAGQNFFGFGAAFPGREWRLSAGSAFVVNLTAGSVVTNTRYWYEVV